jgi:DNA polymerase-3 subunit alpha
MFIHLHCHSHYSFLRAVPSPQELVQAAAEHKMRAVALTDTNGLYAAVPFYLAAREKDVKPIVGTVLDPEFRVTSDEWRVASEKETCRGAACCARFPLLLLATNLAGYTNLCRLVTQRQLEEKPVTLGALSEHREGVLALYVLATRHSEGRSKPAAAGPYNRN